MRDSRSSIFLSSSPPRGMTTSAVAGSAISAASSSCPPSTAVTASAGRPASASAARTTSVRTRFVCAAMREPRRMQALADFRHNAAASTVTLGRAS